MRMRKEGGLARFTRVRALLGASAIRVRALLGARAIKEEPMRGRGKRYTILSLMVWSLLVWIFAAQVTAGLAAQAQAPANANAASDQQAQVEKGRQAVGEACATCHTNILRMVQIYKKSPDQWKDTVYSMIGRGAQVRPDEIEEMTASGGDLRPHLR